MNEILPAILAHDEKTFLERLRLVEPYVSTVHVDIMDGMFVPNKTWFDFAVFASLQTSVKLEFHLMVQDPATAVPRFRNLSCTQRVIWHIETLADHQFLIDACHERSKEAGLGISPQTPIEQLADYQEHLDEILVMGAEPGFSGKTLQPQNIERAREIHHRWPTIPVGFDIGVNAQTIPLLRDAGISRFCAANAIFGAGDPVEEMQKLQRLIM